MTAFNMGLEFASNVKPCKCCGQTKDLSAYPKVPKARDGRGGRCYACAYVAKAALVTDEKRAAAASRTRLWKERNPDKVKARREIDRRLSGRITIEQWRARLQERRVERRTARSVARMDAAIRTDIHRALYVGTWREYGIPEAERYRRRYQQDYGFRRSELIRSRVKKAMRERPLGQSPTVETVLGYSMDDFRLWFEGGFRDGMTWDAFYRGDIHIDHVRPLRCFDLTCDEEMRRAWALQNIQPLWAWENRTKGASDGHSPMLNPLLR